MDLLSPRPFWPLRDGLPATFPALETDIRCDVAVIGAGITGAVIANQLTRAGLDVVVLDRREAAHGSTAGNTGLILYELDLPLVRLSRHIGPRRAERAYQRFHAALEEFRGALDPKLLASEVTPAASLYLAARKRDLPWLKRELAWRQRLGFKVDWWGRSELAKSSSLPHAAGLLTQSAAQVDPYRLTYDLLRAAQDRGARIFDRTAVTRRRIGSRVVTLDTSRKAVVTAREVVIAQGYEAVAELPERMGTLQSTYAFVSEPVRSLPGWPGERTMLWDSGDPYLYFRTTSDSRIIMGGYGEPFRNPKLRDRLLPQKTAALRRRFKQFFPDIPLEISTAWAGTFGVSRDGLPVIGRHPRMPRTWFAIGFGGNGTTASLIAADIIAKGILGRPDPDAKLFAFERTPS